MNKHIISNKKLFKLPILLVTLLGVIGAFSNANARTQYMISSGAPACGSCHLTDPVKGLIIRPTLADPHVLGPVWIDRTEGSTFNINDKVTGFCQRKLHDKNATYNEVYGKSIICSHQAQGAPVLAAAVIGTGVVTESDTLGVKNSANGATDIWAVTCPVDTVQLTVSVRDNLPNNPALVGIQIKKGDAASTTSIDTSESKPTFSSDVTLAAGADIYDVLVNKTAVSKKGIEKYTAKFACTDIDGNVLDITAIEKIQDQ
jgi:hypothetical protein